MAIFKYSFLLLLLYACGNAGSSTPATTTDSGSISQTDTVQHESMPDSAAQKTVKQGDVLTIDLKASAGQGFSWVINDSAYKEKLTYAGQSFTNAAGQKDGTDGVQQFRFQPKSTGEVKLSFIYVQPFNKPFPKEAPAKSFSIKIIP